ncbi:MAG: flavodoxin family protein [Coriobacteriia bacterium]|nr:flavodoxin family protein [Coriobacteriia bacterium]
MSVLIINGSTRERGSTFTALSEVARGLSDSGVESEIVWIGRSAIAPCIACGSCRNRTQGCAHGDDDGVNAIVDKLIAADGMVIGSPVYFAGINGALKCLLDRVFFSTSAAYALKPAACIVAARRAGTTSALEQVQKYPNISQMLLVGSFYWPMVHGQNPDDVRQDLEGMQIAWQLGANMAWLIKTIALGREAGIEALQVETRQRTNFIR